MTRAQILEDMTDNIWRDSQEMTGEEFTHLIQGSPE